MIEERVFDKDGKRVVEKDNTNVVDINDHKPHISGKAKCIACGFTWVAVAPATVDMLQCPECGCMKGAFYYPVMRDGMHWSCNCGNDLFHINNEGPYCARCGKHQRVDYESV